MHHTSTVTCLTTQGWEEIRGYDTHIFVKSKHPLAASQSRKVVVMCHPVYFVCHAKGNKIDIKSN